MQQLEILKSDMGTSTVEFRGKLRVAATSSLIQTLVAPTWAKISGEYPRASVELIEARSQQVVQICQDGLADIGFCFYSDTLRSFATQKVCSGQ